MTTLLRLRRLCHRSASARGRVPSLPPPVRARKRTCFFFCSPRHVLPACCPSETCACIILLHTCPNARARSMRTPPLPHENVDDDNSKKKTGTAGGARACSRSQSRRSRRLSSRPTVTERRGYPRTKPNLPGAPCVVNRKGKPPSSFFLRRTRRQRRKQAHVHVLCLHVVHRW